MEQRHDRLAQVAEHSNYHSSNTAVTTATAPAQTTRCPSHLWMRLPAPSNSLRAVSLLAAMDWRPSSSRWGWRGLPPKCISESLGAGGTTKGMEDGCYSPSQQKGRQAGLFEFPSHHSPECRLQDSVPDPVLQTCAPCYKFRRQLSS